MQYVERAKILEEQDEFARNDLVNNLYVEFIHIVDKRYRCIVAALSAGGHDCLQSFFAHGSDQRYSSNEILYYSGAVAATRSGNERSVRHEKQSCVMKRAAAFRTSNLFCLLNSVTNLLLVTLPRVSSTIQFQNSSRVLSMHTCTIFNCFSFQLRSNLLNQDAWHFQSRGTASEPSK